MGFPSKFQFNYSSKDISDYDWKRIPLKEIDFTMSIVCGIISSTEVLSLRKVSSNSAESFKDIRAYCSAQVSAHCKVDAIS